MNENINWENVTAAIDMKGPAEVEMYHSPLFSRATLIVSCLTFV